MLSLKIDLSTNVDVGTLSSMIKIIEKTVGSQKGSLKKMLKTIVGKDLTVIHSLVLRKTNDEDYALSLNFLPNTDIHSRVGELLFQQYQNSGHRAWTYHGE